MRKIRHNIITALSVVALFTLLTNLVPQKAVFIISLLVFGTLLYIPVALKNIFPCFIPGKTRLVLAFLFQYSTLVFIALSLVLGSWFRFYEDFIWWDMFLHFLAGVIFAVPGYCLIYKGAENVRNFMAFWVPLCVSLAISALWEIYEFTGDILFGMTMQGNGISDTMEDLIACFVAAIVTSTALYFLSKKYNKN